MKRFLPVEMEDLDDAYICFNIGNLYYDLGKIENALTYYDKSSLYLSGFLLMLGNTWDLYITQWEDYKRQQLAIIRF